MACKPTYRGVRYNSIQELLQANNLVDKYNALLQGETIEEPSFVSYTEVLSGLDIETGDGAVRVNLPNGEKVMYENDLGSKLQITREEPAVDTEEETVQLEFDKAPDVAPEPEQSSYIFEELKSILENMGVTVTTLDWYNEVTGQQLDEKALVDLSRAMVALSKGESELLAEELGHIIIEHQVDSYEFKRALKLVEKTDEYKTWYSTYIEKYDGDKEKVAKEVLGKLLSEHILKGIARRKDNTLMGMLRRLWNNFKSLFTERNELERFLETISDETLDGRYTNVRGEGIFFSTVKEEDKKIDEFLNKAVDVIRKKNAIDMERKLPPELRKKREFTTGKMSNSLSKKLYVQAVLDMIQMTKLDVKNAKEIVEGVQNGSLEINATITESIRQFVNYYRPLMSELKDLIENQYLQIEDGYYPTLRARRPHSFAELRPEDQFYYIQDAGKYFKVDRNSGKKTRISLKDYEGETSLKDAIIKRLNNYISDFAVIEEFEKQKHEEVFKDVVRDFAAKELNFDREDPNLDEKIEKKTGMNINKEAKEVTDDTTFMGSFVGSLRYSSPKILNLLYAVVSRIRAMINKDTYNFGQEIIREAEKYGFLGQDLTWVYEKDENGNNTGLYLDKYRNTEWKSKLDEFRTEMHEKYGFPQDAIERKYHKAVLAKNEDPTLWRYNNEMKEWFIKNTKLVDNYKEIIKQRKEELTPNEYAEWESWNIVSYTNYKGEEFTYFTGELVRPSDGSKSLSLEAVKNMKLGRLTEDMLTSDDYITTNDWRNKSYESLTPDKRAFLDFIKEKKKFLDVVVGLRNNEKAPQITESLLDIFYSKKPDMFKHLGSRVRDNFKLIEDDKELYGIKSTYRPDGSVQRYLPKRYINLLENPNDLTPDVLSALINYSDMAFEYRRFSQKIDEFEAIQTQVGRREYRSKKGSLPGNRSHAYNALSKFFEMHIYGQKQTMIDAGKYSIPITKAVKGFGKYASALNLMWNLYTVASGFFQSSTKALIETNIGEYYRKVTMKKALKEFSTNFLPHAMKESGKAMKNNKAAILLLNVRVWDSKRVYSNLNKDRITRKADQSLLWGPYQVADTAVKGPVALAVAYEIRIVDGKVMTYLQLQENGMNPDAYPSFYDSIEIEDGQMKVYHKDANGNKQLLDDYQLAKALGYIETAAKDTEGQLTEEDRAAIHQHAITNMLTTHRGWFITFFQKRTRARSYDFMTGSEDVGYWIAMRDFIRDNLFGPERVGSIKEMLANYNELSFAEKRALKRALYDMIAALLITVLTRIVNAIADEEDEEYLNALAYLTNRVTSELSSFVFPFVIYETAKTIQNPLVVMDKIEQMLDIGQLLAYDEEVLSGPYKGMNKSWAYILKKTPIVSSFIKMSDVQKANQFLINKSLRLHYIFD